MIDLSALVTPDYEQLERDRSGCILEIQQLAIMGLLHVEHDIVQCCGSVRIRTLMSTSTLYRD